MGAVSSQDADAAIDRLFPPYWSAAGPVPGYASYVLPPLGGGGDRYYDDDGWVGLDLVRQHRSTGSTAGLAGAQAALAFVLSGWDTDPTHPYPGGVFWVEAAFKENQLKHMRVGEPATITVDAYPGYTFDAVVDSLAPGTDQTFSLLPAENATGNWVKVVQRLPVRLTLVKPPPIALQGGLSAKVKVDTGYRRGLTGSHPAR